MQQNTKGCKVMKLTKEQKKIVDQYKKENNLTNEQVVNYLINILEQELEN